MMVPSGLMMTPGSPFSPCRKAGGTIGGGWIGTDARAQEGWGNAKRYLQPRRALQARRALVPFWSHRALHGEAGGISHQQQPQNGWQDRGASHQSLTAPSSSHKFWLSASLLTEGSPLAQPNPIHLPYSPRGELGGCFPNLSPGRLPPAPAGPRGLPHRWLRGPPNSPGSRRGPVCPAGGRTQVRTGGSSAATQPCQPHGQQGAGLPTSGPGTAAKDLCKNNQNVVF